MYGRSQGSVKVLQLLDNRTVATETDFGVGQLAASQKSGSKLLHSRPTRL